MPIMYVIRPRDATTRASGAAWRSGLKIKAKTVAPSAAARRQAITRAVNSVGRSTMVTRSGSPMIGRTRSPDCRSS